MLKNKEKVDLGQERPANEAFGPRARHRLHARYQLIFRKSTPPQNRQLNILISIG